MTTNDGDTKTGFLPKQSLVMAVVFLIVGLSTGYVIRGVFPGTRSTKAVGMGMAADTARMPANAPPRTTPEQLKQMADEQAQPIVAKLKTEPNDTASLIQLGDLRYDAAQYKQAIFYYERSLALDRKNVRVRVDLANAYEYLGEPDRAISEYETALKFDPKNSLALLNLGVVQWRNKGNINAAVASWEKLLKSDPKFAQQAQVERLIAKAKEHASMTSPHPAGK